MGHLRSGYGGLGGHLGTGLGGWSGGSILGSILGYSGPYSRPVLGNLIIYPYLAFIWPWVGLNPRNILILGSWDGTGWVPV